MTNGEKFKEVFGYEPATDEVVCNKEDWCGASEPCNYCMSNPNKIDREENWWNAEYKEPIIKALGEELRKVREGIKNEKVLIGFNMAVAICNKHLEGSEDKK